MCFYYDSYCSVYEQTIRFARKPHKCESCRRQIEPREQYLDIFSICEGEACGESLCNQCVQDWVAIHRHELASGCRGAEAWAYRHEIHHLIRRGNPDEDREPEVANEDWDGHWPVLFWPYGVAPACLPVDLKTFKELAE